MNFFIMVSLFLSAALGVFRGIDLALLTDAETGLCIVGSVWLRYGALAVAVGAAVAAGRCCKPQAGALRGRCTPSGTGPGALPARHVGRAHPLCRRAGGVCPLPVLGAAHRAADPRAGGRRGSADADAAVPAGTVLCGRFGSLERCALHKD